MLVFSEIFANVLNEYFPTRKRKKKWLKVTENIISTRSTMKYTSNKVQVIRPIKERTKPPQKSKMESF